MQSAGLFCQKATEKAQSYKCLGHEVYTGRKPWTKGTDNGGQNGCPPSEVDGTTCQYSECGKGFGLASCSIGVVQGVKGGKNGQKYVLIDDLDHSSSPTKGSLRYGVNLARESSGIWIMFEKDMIIHLEDMLWVQSRTTYICWF